MKRENRYSFYNTAVEVPGEPGLLLCKIESVNELDLNIIIDLAKLYGKKVKSIDNIICFYNYKERQGSMKFSNI